MMLFPLVALLAAAPLPENTVAFVAFQGAGKTAELTTSTLDALAKEVSTRGFPTMPAADLERHQRSAAMCGEDGACLATIGKLANVGWVLAIGVGTAGKQTLFTALLIDVGGGKVHLRYETKSKGALDATATAKAAVDALFIGVTLKEPPPPPPLVNDSPVAPKEPVKLEPPPRVAAAPQYRFRGAAIGLGVGAGVAAITGVTFSILAASNFSRLPTVPAGERAVADGTQRTFNLTADLALGVAIAAGVTTLVLLLIDGPGSTP